MWFYLKREIHLNWKILSLQAKIKLSMLSLKIGNIHLCIPARLACDSSIQNRIFHGRWPEYFCLSFWINTESWPGYLWAPCKAWTTTGSDHPTAGTETKPTLLFALTSNTSKSFNIPRTRNQNRSDHKC